MIEMFVSFRCMKNIHIRILGKTVKYLPAQVRREKSCNRTKHAKQERR